MSNITSYFSHKILDFLLGRNAYTNIPTYYVGLSKTPMGVDGAGVTAPSGGGYARLAIPNNKTSFSVAASKVVNFIQEFRFPESTDTAAGEWGDISHFTIYDSLSGGNMLLFGALREPRHMERLSTLVLKPNDNQLGLDVCGGSDYNMAITTYAANLILNHLFGYSPTLTPPANYYLGVSLQPVSSEGTGIVEPSAANGYARVQLPNNKTTFTTGNNKTITLNSEFAFNPSTNPWGTVTHYFISDAASGGNIWWSGKLNLPRTVEISTILTVKPNSFTWQLESCPLII